MLRCVFCLVGPGSACGSGLRLWADDSPMALWPAGCWLRSCFVRTKSKPWHAAAVPCVQCQHQSVHAFFTVASAQQSQRAPQEATLPQDRETWQLARAFAWCAHNRGHCVGRQSVRVLLATPLLEKGADRHHNATGGPGTQTGGEAAHTMIPQHRAQGMQRGILQLRTCVETTCNSCTPHSCRHCRPQTPILLLPLAGVIMPTTALPGPQVSAGL
jgi:hypothetical protein